MKIIIAGSGQVGSHLAKLLSYESQEITLIDSNDEKLTSPTNNCAAMIIPFEAKYTGYADLTGKFPYTPTRGNQYIMVVYDYDSNAILAKATKTCSSFDPYICKQITK